MKISPTPEPDPSGNEQVLNEMKIFLLALASYPERFASDSTITFEEHRSSLMPTAKAKSAAA